MSSSDSESGRDNDQGPPAPWFPIEKHVPPQQNIDKFWKKFTTKRPGKVFTILPDNLYAKRAALQASRGAATSENAVASYDQAAATCKAKVEKIARDCRRLNQKYKDPHFDIEFDFMQWNWNPGYIEDCLVELHADESTLRPMAVKRVEVGVTFPCFHELLG